MFATTLLLQTETIVSLFVWGFALDGRQSDMMRSRRGKKARWLTADVFSLPSFVEILFLHIIDVIDDIIDMDRCNLLAMNWMQSESEKDQILYSQSISELRVAPISPIYGKLLKLKVTHFSLVRARLRAFHKKSYH